MARFLRVLMIEVLLMGLLDLSKASLLPRISFSWGSQERLLGIFQSSAVKNNTTLLLSHDAQTLFVGAQEALLSLDVSQPHTITLKDKLEWAVSPENMNICKKTSKSDCSNIISILQFFNSTHLYACGTNANKPQAIIVPTASLSSHRDTKDAKNCCPYSATRRNTATIVGEELYSASHIGFFGNKRIISRCHSRGTHNNLELESVPKLLQEPEFVASTHVASEGKILIFFSETGELSGDSFMSSFTVSRVAQVCTDDNGGRLTLQKRWTSFAKAQLLCQHGKSYQFNKLKDVFRLDSESPEQTLFYGLFSSQWSASSIQTAVCAFTLKDIKAAFSGDYKTFDLVQNHWSKQPNTDGKLGKCGLFNDTDRVLNIVKKSFLTEQPVRPLGNKVLLSTVERYSHLAVHTTHAANGDTYTVLYLLTKSGFLHKVILLDDGPHIIEEVKVFRKPQNVKNIILSNNKVPNKGVLFFGSSEGVFQVPVSNCSSYQNCAECVLARDPFCGWHSERGMCTMVSGSKSNLRQDVERGNITDQCSEFLQTPATVTQISQLHDVVVLPCKSRSRLAKVTWRFSNNSHVPQFAFQQHLDGSLVFTITPQTLDTYHCVSEELGFEQTMAVFALVLPIMPQSQTPPIHQQSVPIPAFTTLKQDSGKILVGRDEKRSRINSEFNTEDTMCISQKSYYSEMVAFCILFVFCFFVFVGFVLLWWLNLRCSKISPQLQKDNVSDKIWQTELEEKKT